MVPALMMMHHVIINVWPAWSRCWCARGSWFRYWLDSRAVSVVCFCPFYLKAWGETPAQCPLNITTQHTSSTISVNYRPNRLKTLKGALGKIRSLTARWLLDLSGRSFFFCAKSRPCSRNPAYRIWLTGGTSDQKQAFWYIELLHFC